MKKITKADFITRLESASITTDTETLCQDDSNGNLRLGWMYRTLTLDGMTFCYENKCRFHVDRPRILFPADRGGSEIWTIEDQDITIHSDDGTMLSDYDLIDIVTQYTEINPFQHDIDE